MDGGMRGTGRLRERPTIDLVVLVFVLVVAVLMLGTLVTLAILEIRDPGIDTSEVTALLDAHTGTIIGALLGLIAGQAQARGTTSG